MRVRPHLLRTPALALAGLVLVAVLLGFAVASFMSFDRARNLMDNTIKVRGGLWRSLRLLEEAETGQRGFLLTDDASYLGPYERAIRELPDIMRTLVARSGDDAAQQGRLAELARLSKARLEEVAQTIELQKQGRGASALAIVKSNRGQDIMREIRALEAAMVSTEDQYLAQRATSAAAISRASLVITALVSCLLVFLGYLLHAIGRDLKRGEIEKLRAADLENFAGRVAHDVRSPLTSVSLAVDVARRHPEIDPKLDVTLDRAARTLQRVGELVDGLLVFASAGGVPSKEAQADVQAIVGEVVEGMRPSAEDKDIDLQVEDLCNTVLACSPGVLISMVSNLVGNAIKYIGDSPVKRVRVRARRQGAMTRVEVEDTGPGIPREQRDRIFNPYVRAAASKVPGLGLGLATVRRLAEAHGGGVGIANTEAGSLFWFELPSIEGPHPGRARTQAGRLPDQHAYARY